MGSGRRGKTLQTMSRRRKRRHHVKDDDSEGEEWKDCAQEPDMTTFYRVVANFESCVRMSNDPIREYHKLVDAYRPPQIKPTTWRNAYDDVFLRHWTNNSPEIQAIRDDPIKPEDWLRVTYRDSIEDLLRDGYWPKSIAKPYIPER